MFDLNNDKFICETDLFNIVTIIENKHLRMIITPDINTALDFIKSYRIKIGKDDIAKMKTIDALKNVELAHKKNKLINHSNHA